MELKQYISTLWRWNWLIVLATLVAAVYGYWGTQKMPRIYKTSTTLMVGRFVEDPTPRSQDFSISQQLAGTYVHLVRRQPILQAAAEALGLNIGWRSLAGQVSASVVPGTQLIQISAVDTDPQRAKIIADEVAHQLILQSPTTPEKEQEQHRQFVNQQLLNLQARIGQAEKEIEDLDKQLALETSARGIQDIQSRMAALQQTVTTWQSNYASLLDFYKGSRTNYLSVVEPAAVPIIPISPKVRINILLAASIGFLLATAAAFLLEYLDDTIKTGEDVAQVLKLPILGAITRIQKIREPSDQLVVMYHPRSPVSEAYRILRTNIQFSNLGNPSATLLVTSASLAEGKSVTSANLALAMAQAGKRVILVDADLRRPDLHRFFGVPNTMGLTNLLLDDEMLLEAALLDVGTEGLKLLPSGTLPPNPAELLASEPMKARVSQMKKSADIVIFDSPPVLFVADATILGALCSGAILAVHAGRTRSDVVRRGKETLDQVGVRILGVVLNRISTRRAGDYYHYYYGHYSHVSDE